MRIENRVDGASIMRRGDGLQRLCVATSHTQEVLILSRLDRVVSVKRHWSEDKQQTAPCECTQPCSSQRLDRFCESLVRVGPTLWEERLLVLPADAWNCLERTLILKGVASLETAGARCILRRSGDKRNGRTSCEYQDTVRNVPEGFNLVAAMRSSAGIAADFFGDSEGVAFPQELPPARTRQDKPHVPLGKSHGK